MKKKRGKSARAGKKEKEWPGDFEFEWRRRGRFLLELVRVDASMAGGKLSKRRGEGKGKKITKRNQEKERGESS